MVLFQLISGAVANRGVAISTLAITIAAVFIAVGSWHLGSDVIPSVLDAEKRLSKFRELSLGELVVDEPSARDDLLGEVTEVRADLGYLPPFGAVGRAFCSGVVLAPAGQPGDEWVGQPGRACSKGPRCGVHNAAIFLATSRRIPRCSVTYPVHPVRFSHPPPEGPGKGFAGPFSG